MLHNPKLLLLDEPATGLDPAARRDVWNELTELREQNGLTALMTTHLMDEADRCDRLAVMHQGQIVAVDTPANLKAAIRGHVISIVANTDPDGLAQRITDNFAPWPDNTTPRVVQGTIYLEKPDGPAIIAKIAQVFTGEIQSITLSQPTLEDVFLHLTGNKLGE
jgi:ABC-2 type transport system ATP-binding protein